MIELVYISTFLKLAFDHVYLVPVRAMSLAVLVRRAWRRLQDHSFNDLLQSRRVTESFSLLL